MSNPLKISILDNTDTEDFEKLCVLLKKFSLETYLGNKPEFAELKGNERYQLLCKAMKEFDGKEKNSVLSMEDIEEIKKGFEHQIMIAKKLINDERKDVKTRYYILKDEDDIVCFHQGQVSKDENRIEGWRNLIYIEPAYRGKKGEILDIHGNLTETSYFEALFGEMGEWFNENEVNYERICTGVNMLHNIQKYINSGFLPFQKNDSNIFLEKYIGQTLDKSTLNKVYELYRTNRQKLIGQDINETIEGTKEFASLMPEQKEGIAQTCAVTPIKVREFIDRISKMEGIEVISGEKINKFIEEYLEKINKLAIRKNRVSDLTKDG